MSLQFEKASKLTPEIQAQFLQVRLEILKQQFGPYLGYDHSENGYQATVSRVEQFIQSLH
jgi:hypothetical protein